VSVAPWRLFCFDLDGTLIYRTSTCQHLADHLGHADSHRDFEDRYATGAISNREVAEGTAFHYRGRTVAEITAYMQSVPLIGGINETMEYLRRKSIPALLSTVTWRFAAESIARRFGFVDFSGTEMSEDDQRMLLGVVSRDCDEFDKRDFVAGFCSAHGIAASQVVAIGDSRSDIPLFQWSGFSVALNANAAARAAAKVAVDTDDLRNILKVIPDLDV
jgi:phosphoserine phosphatase